jgi:GAF domain-containing protein
MPSKSFRVAADRIVRQESASPTDVLALLGSPNEAPRAIASENDEWDARLGALRVIGEYDALAVVASKPASLSHAHNVSDRVALDDAVVDARDEAMRTGMAVQRRFPIALADGRMSTELMVAPLGHIAGVEGVLLALRSGRNFSAADAARAASIGTVLAVEVTRAAEARQDARTRQQAIGLFELARIGIAEHDLDERLLVMVEVAAKSFRHDVAQVWLLRGGGSLRLRAAYPRESLVLEIARPRDHAPLARALDGEVFRVTGPSLRSWIRRTTHELIIAPLRSGEGVSGLLALGRWSEGYSGDDVELAARCADFFGPVVAVGGAVRSSRAASRDGEAVDEAEGSLTAS